MTVGYWFRRDRRIGDNEALTLAAREAKRLDVNLAAFYLSQSFAEKTPEFAPSPLREHSLFESLRALDISISNNLTVAETLEDAVQALREARVSSVYAMKAYDPDGVRTEQKMAATLGSVGIALRLHGSAYAVSPGHVLKDDGFPLKVYTPFFKRWLTIDPRQPLPAVAVAFVRLNLPSPQRPSVESPWRVRAGAEFATATLQRFLLNRVSEYSTNRDRADLGGTSHLSHALSHGEIHPRTILAALPGGVGAEVFRREIAWREFYADVLHHNPHSLWGYFDPKYAAMRYDEGKLAEERFDAWRLGQTGYPIVDAGMRQLLQTGWMHNRVRMITASFLVKDLHLPWARGAAWFESQLTDFDPASNAHGWQWTAGCGTDASPYFRVFNPTLQGQKFDPSGDYVRRFVSELDHLGAKEIHEPWKFIDGLSKGYPAPIVDHAAERDEALRRLDELKQRVNRN